MPYRGDRDKYFHKPLSVNVVPELKTFFDTLPGAMGETDLRLFKGTPDESKSPTLQLILSLMILHFKELYDREGAEGIERTFAPLVGKIEELVWPHMVKRGTTAAARESKALAEAAEAAKKSAFSRKTEGGETQPIRPRPRKKSPE